MRQILSFFIIIILCSETNAHVGHNSNLKELNFEIYRNNKYVGYHNITFNWDKTGVARVQNDIEFAIKKLGITLYKYSSTGTEKYNSLGKLTSFQSKTDDNGREKNCSIKLNGKKYDIKGTKFNGEFDKSFLISSYWNHDIVTVQTQASGITCKIQNQKVTFLKEEERNVNGQIFKTRVFDIKGKKLDTQVWYDIESRMIVHQVLNKKGKWEYKLKSFKLNK